MFGGKCETNVRRSLQDEFFFFFCFIYSSKNLFTRNRWENSSLTGLSPTRRSGCIEIGPAHWWTVFRLAFVFKMDLIAIIGLTVRRA